MPYSVAKIGLAQTKVGTMHQYQQIGTKTRNTQYEAHILRTLSYLSMFI